MRIKQIIFGARTLKGGALISKIRVFCNSTIFPPLNGRVFLITALRNRSWIDWGFYASCVLRLRGIKSVVLLRRNEISKLYGDAFLSAISVIPDIEIVDLDCVQIPSDFAQTENLNLDFLVDSVAYDEHVERSDILKSKDIYQNKIEVLNEKALKSACAIADASNRFPIDTFVLYSGLIEDTPAMLQSARNRGLRVICVEGWAWRKGHLIYNLNEPALEYNIKGWIDHYGWTEETEKSVDEYLSFQDGKQIGAPSWLRSFYNVQKSSVDRNLSKPLRDFVTRFPKSFVLAPNVIGDSSTLNRETIFGSMQEWIRETIDYFKESKDQSLIVRAHPAETWAKGKVKLKIGALAREYAKGIENVFVLDGTDKTNSFSLLPYSKVCLVWLSSIGVDYVVRGVPCISAANAKYSGLGIVEEPSTRATYFEMLRRFSSNNYGTVLPEQIFAAKKYIHAVFKGFSFPAHGDDFTAETISSFVNACNYEHRLFFDIITGGIGMPDRSNEMHLKDLCR